jgi:hypothetical protein
MSLGQKQDPSLESLNRLFRIVGISTGVILAGPLMLVSCVVVTQYRKDRDFEDLLKPSIHFIEAFQMTNHRLPSQREFAARPNAEPNYMVQYLRVSEYPHFAKEGARTEIDFCVTTWRGENSTFYYSWKKGFDIVEPR